MKFVPLLSSVCRYLLIPVISMLVLLPASLQAQFTPGVNNTIKKMYQWSPFQSYSNVWGYIDAQGREYAIIGHNGGTSFFNITDPQNTAFVGTVPGTTPTGSICWREIKTYGHYAYIVSEHLTPVEHSGVQIVDLQYMPDSIVYVKRYLWPGVTEQNARAHTVTVDGQGYLYIQGGTATLGEIGDQGGIRILSLADPLNPVSVGVFAPRYVHDTFIRNNRIFAHNVYENPARIDVVDISNKANPTLVIGHIYNGLLAHNSWIDSTRPEILATTDESTGRTVKFWNISVLWDTDPNNDDQIQLVSEYIGSPQDIAHEPRIMGNYCFVSHYALGVKVLDVTNAADPVEVGYYDTQPAAGNGFIGNWGVWPFYPSGSFIVSDMQNGLFVFRMDTVKAGGIIGTVIEQGTNVPVAGVSVSFLEAAKQKNTDANGAFAIRTNAGMHTIIFSKQGYFTDTVDVEITAGASQQLNHIMRPNQAQISLSATQVTAVLAPDSMVQVPFVITNSGPAGSLQYSLRAINGPFTPTAQPATEVYSIIDPTGDLVFGSGGDVTAVNITKTIASYNFEIVFAENVDVTSAFVVFGIDIDFNSATGAFPGGFGELPDSAAIGSEYDILVDVSGNITGIGNRAYIFTGSNFQGGSAIAYRNITVAGNKITFGIQYTALGGKKNITIAGLSGHYSNGAPTSIDYLPNLGNLTVGVNPNGNVPWLTLSQTAGNLMPAAADTIYLTFSSAGLAADSSYQGVLVIQSSDEDEEFKTVPLTLTVPGLTLINDKVHPKGFALFQNYPNPFNPHTAISFSLPKKSEVSLKVFNLLGNEVTQLVNEVLPDGLHTVSFDGSKLPSGIYFYRLTANGQSITKKLTLMK